MTAGANKFLRAYYVYILVREVLPESRCKITRNTHYGKVKNYFASFLYQTNHLNIYS